jgi:hypothetical protein
VIAVIALLAGAVIVAGVIASPRPAAAAPVANARADRYAAMPAPEGIQSDEHDVPDAAVTTGYTLGPRTIRLRGRLTLYRLNEAAGTVTNMRRVELRTANVYLARDEVARIGNTPYARIVSGPYAGWWVPAAAAAADTNNRLASGTQVRVPGGRVLGVRFYADREVRLRKSVEFANPQTFTANREATFGGHRYFLVGNGPLAGRWVAAERGATLLSDSTAGSGANPEPTPTATPQPTVPPTPRPTATPQPTAAPAATWKGLVLIYPETDVTFTRADGTDYRLQTRMSGAMRDLVVDTVDRFNTSVRTWSNGVAAMEMDVVDVPHGITSLDKLSSSYWVGPRSVEADIDQYAPTGTYDSIFVIWQAKDAAGEKVPVGGWGLTLPPGGWANGAGYSSVITPSQMWWWTNSSAPEEVFVHEWMHQVVYHNENTQAGFDFDLHAGRDYGYDDSDGTWKRWLSDVMQGKVRNGDQLLGISRSMWAAGSPRQVTP